MVGFILELSGKFFASQKWQNADNISSKIKKVNLRFKLLLKTGGIVMTEALMAVSLMASAVVITGSIIESTVSTTKQTRDFAIAQNLANEAVSGVKNIINSNKILYPNNSDCWLVYNTDYCEPLTNTPKENSNYLVSMKNGRWILEDTVSKYDLDLDFEDSSNNDLFQLYLQKMKVGEVEFPMYTTVNTEQSEPSPFFRSVKFSEITNELVTFSVKVQWKDRSKTRSYSIDTTIGNTNS